MSERCCKRVHSGKRWDFGGHQCEKAAKVERDGKRYCTTHDPERVAKKDAEKQEQWHQERIARSAEINRQNGIKALGEFMLSAVKHRLFITAVEFEDCREIARKHGLLD